MLVRGGEQALGGGFVEAAGEDDTVRFSVVGFRVSGPDGGAHIVERRHHRGIVAGLLERRVHADGGLEVVGGDEDAIMLEKLLEHREAFFHSIGGTRQIDDQRLASCPRAAAREPGARKSWS